MIDMYAFLLLAGLGSIGGMTAWRWNPSGKLGLALTVVPVAGVGLAMAYC